MMLHNLNFVAALAVQSMVTFNGGQITDRLDLKQNENFILISDGEMEILSRKIKTLNDNIKSSNSPTELLTEVKRLRAENRDYRFEGEFVLLEQNIRARQNEIDREARRPQEEAQAIKQKQQDISIKKKQIDNRIQSYKDLAASKPVCSEAAKAFEEEAPRIFDPENDWGLDIGLKLNAGRIDEACQKANYYSKSLRRLQRAFYECDQQASATYNAMLSPFNDLFASGQCR